MNNWANLEENSLKNWTGVKVEIRFIYVSNCRNMCLSVHVCWCLCAFSVKLNMLMLSWGWGKACFLFVSIQRFKYWLCTTCTHWHTLTIMSSKKRSCTDISCWFTLIVVVYFHTQCLFSSCTWNRNISFTHQVLLGNITEDFCITPPQKQSKL